MRCPFLGVHNIFEVVSGSFISETPTLNPNFLDSSRKPPAGLKHATEESLGFAHLAGVLLAM